MWRPKPLEAECVGVEHERFDAGSGPHVAEGTRTLRHATVRVDAAVEGFENWWRISFCLRRDRPPAEGVRTLGLPSTAAMGYVTNRACACLAKSIRFKIQAGQAPVPRALWERENGAWRITTCEVETP
jgi:hypothetical protein